MRVAYVSVIALMLITGCSNVKSSAQMPVPNYTYMVSADEAQCKTLITIGGGLKTNCAQ
jgi:hypothetical protein